MILLEGNMSGLGILIFGVMFGPAIILAIIGFILSRNNSKQGAKVLYILAVSYLVISLGFCGVMMA